MPLPLRRSLSQPEATSLHSLPATVNSSRDPGGGGGVLFHAVICLPRPHPGHKLLRVTGSRPNLSVHVRPRRHVSPLHARHGDTFVDTKNTELAQEPYTPPHILHKARLRLNAPAGRRLRSRDARRARGCTVLLSYGGFNKGEEDGGQSKERRLTSASCLAAGRCSDPPQPNDICCASSAAAPLPRSPAALLRWSAVPDIYGAQEQ